MLGGGKDTVKPLSLNENSFPSSGRVRTGGLSVNYSINPASRLRKAQWGRYGCILWLLCSCPVTEHNPAPTVSVLKGIAWHPLFGANTTSTVCQQSNTSPATIRNTKLELEVECPTPAVHSQHFYHAGISHPKPKINKKWYRLGFHFPLGDSAVYVSTSVFK